jgi:hypothetical protein
MGRYDIETPVGKTRVVTEKIILQEEGLRDVEVYRATNLETGLQSGSTTERAAYQNVVPSVTLKPSEI